MRIRTFLPATAIALLIAACGGGGDGNAGPGPGAAAIQRSAGDSQVAPVATTLGDSLAVLVTDTAAQPVAGVTVHWAVTGGGSVSPSTSVTGLDGVARAARTLGGTAGTAGTTATVTGIAPLIFTAVGQVQGAVTMIANTVGALTDTVHGTLLDPEPLPSVLVTDQHGTPVAGVNVIWSATSGGAVTATTVPTDAQGISNVGFTFNGTAGAAGARATVVGLVNSPVAFGLTSTHGAPTQLSKVTVDGGIVEPGTTLTETVLVTDSYGNPVGGVTIDWAATAGGGNVAPATSVTGGTGRATTVLTAGANTGVQTVSASAPDLAGAPTLSLQSVAAFPVLVGNNFFDPAGPTITAGDSIPWQWQGITAIHNITFAAAVGAPADVPDRTSGVVWRVFTTPGNFSYQCTNHAGMVATIHVVP